MNPPGRFMVWARLTLLVACALLATACASTSSPDPDCVRRCDVGWDACSMTCDREKMACDAGCADRPACRERCAAAHPLERARCDELHERCVGGCSGS